MVDIAGGKIWWDLSRNGTTKRALTRPLPGPEECVQEERERETAQSTACQEHEKDGAIDRQGDAPQRERRKK